MCICFPLLYISFCKLTTTRKIFFCHFAMSGRNLCKFHVLAMSHDLQQWFKPVNTLPQPKGPLCTTISPDNIRNANKEVHKVGTSSRSFRRAYIKVASKQQAKIVQYASMHGNVAAVRRFSKE